MLEYKYVYCKQHYFMIFFIYPKIKPAKAIITLASFVTHLMSHVNRTSLDGRGKNNTRNAGAMQLEG